MTQGPTRTTADPRTLKKNPWNPNVVDPLNQEKIKRSIMDEGFFKDVIVRELDDGSLEIIGGEHRNDAAIELGLDEVPITNLGRIDDARAKRIGLLDNGRYGHDDPYRMAELLSNGDIGSADDLLSVLPISEEELSAFFDHTFDDDLKDLDDLTQEEQGGDESDDIDLGTGTPAKTHQILRFKVSIEDAAEISERINRIRRDQGFTESDDLTNSGDALVWLLRQMTK